MLQIIGWLMCAYMVVKACELFGNAYQSTTEKARLAYGFGAVLALMSGLLFVLLINGQANSSSSGMRGITESSSSSGSSDAWNNLEAVAGKAAQRKAAEDAAYWERAADDLSAMEENRAAADNASGTVERSIPE